MYFLSHPLSLLINFFGSMFGGNFALSIIACTLIIRSLLFPLYLKQIKNGIIMKKIQPELVKLKEKFADKPQELMIQEMSKLYSKYNLNPMSMIYVAILQLPILIGLYHAILISPEISSFKILWITLGQPDPLKILPIFAGLTMYISNLFASVEITSGFKIMLYIAPISVVLVGLHLSSAISLYWIVSNIFAAIQSLVANKFFKKKYEQSYQ
jgi:YidC/Oxa1 family membrane protein insertase